MKKWIFPILVFIVAFLAREISCLVDGTGIFLNGVAFGSGSSLAALGIAAIVKSVCVVMIGLIYVDDPDRENMYKLILEKRKANKVDSTTVEDYWTKWAKANNIWNVNPYAAMPSYGGKKGIRETLPMTLRRPRHRLPQPGFPKSVKINHELARGMPDTARRKVYSKAKSLKIGEYDTQENYQPAFQRTRINRRIDIRRKEDYEQKATEMEIVDECWKKFICQLTEKIVLSTYLKAKVLKPQLRDASYVLKAMGGNWFSNHLNCGKKYDKCLINYNNFISILPKTNKF